MTYEITSVSFGCASTWTVEAKSPAEARRVARAHLNSVPTGRLLFKLAVILRLFVGYPLVVLTLRFARR